LNSRAGGAGFYPSERENIFLNVGEKDPIKMAKLEAGDAEIPKQSQKNGKNFGRIIKVDRVQKSGRFKKNTKKGGACTIREGAKFNGNIKRKGGRKRGEGEKEWKE